MVFGSKNAGRLALAAVLVGVAAPALAQEKIGVIDVARIMTESKRGLKVMSALEALEAEKRAELKVLNDEVLALQTRLQEGRLSLAADKLADLQNELESKGRDFERAREDAEITMQKRRAGDIKEVESAVLPIINQVGNELGYSLIFNKFQSGLVFAAEGVDITDAVLARFDQASDD